MRKVQLMEDKNLWKERNKYYTAKTIVESIKGNLKVNRRFMINMKKTQLEYKLFRQQMSILDKIIDIYYIILDLDRIIKSEYHLYLIKRNRKRVYDKLKHYRKEMKDYAIYKL